MTPHLRLIPAAGLALALAGGPLAAAEWRVEQVDDAGAKPALGLMPDGSPVIVYMLEAQQGWVRAALRDGDAWTIEQPADGYFYGPPDVAVGPDGVVHAAFHDHQAPAFQPNLGDAVYLRRENGAWTKTEAVDQGHDGWDNRITTDSAGRPHMVGVDPVEFGGRGVEYYAQLDDGTWVVEPLGTGPQTYRWAISVAVDDLDLPWVTYHDGATKQLKLAHRTLDGWEIETVDDAGDTGFFSELRIAPDGTQHISYYQMDGSASGNVKHAERAGPGGDWTISDLGRLENVFLGFTGARNITSIDLDADGNPWVAFSDEAAMMVAHREGGEWVTETVVESDGTPLGQILSMELDDDGRPHIAYAQVTNKSALNGTIWYATTVE